VSARAIPDKIYRQNQIFITFISVFSDEVVNTMFSGLTSFGDAVGKGNFNNYLAALDTGLGNNFGPAMLNAAAHGSAMKAGMNMGAANAIGAGMLTGGLGLGKSARDL